VNTAPDPNLPSQPAVIAHRGASAAAPENSLKAFRLAGEMGADWVELDIHLTADEQIVVIHDATYPDGRLAWHTPADDRPPGICLLAEALEVCASAHMSVNIEIKALPGEPDADSGPRLVEVLLAFLGDPARANHSPDQLLITSFWPPTIDDVRSNSVIPTGWLTLDTTEPTMSAERLRTKGHVAINPWDPLITPELVTAAHASGLTINAWTVNDPGRMQELAQWGVDGIITDAPDVARAALQ